MASGHSDEETPDVHELVLPAEGVEDLTDQLTHYMTEIELGGLTDIMGQVLDDFLDQCGGMPEDLSDASAFERITGGQLAVTLAYQVGRLEGRSPQIVNRLIRQAVEKWRARELVTSEEISDADLRNPKELVYPRLRRLQFTEPPGGEH
ncbi:MAG: hypothetical protein OXN21_07985 [Chloroflexota bacterium]|nr:hypothetical protein [Chloroflexota bacterium]